MNKLISLFAAVFCVVASHMPLRAEKVEYVPKFGGVIVTRYEGRYTSDVGWENSFKVLYARVHVGGQLLPQLSYFAQVDLCDQGKMKFLDAWARWTFSPSWKVQLGQFRVPFGIDAFRGPGTFVFANRAFIVKNMVNLRQVGFKVGYYGNSRLPLTLEAGVFNSKDKENHNQWQKAMDWAAKALYRVGPVSLSTSFVSLQPYTVRMNIVDAAVGYYDSRWTAEAEFLNQHYTHKRFRNVKGYSVFASYGIPVKWDAFHTLSFQARFDGMGSHSSGAFTPEGGLVPDDRARRRITVGSTVAALKAPLSATFKINVEKYLYNGESFGASPTMLCLEAVVMF